jgi:hypothetical protein
MKNLVVNSSLFLFIFLTYTANAAIYEFDAALTGSQGYYQSYCNPSEACPDGDSISSGELAEVGEPVHVSLNYDTSAYDSDHGYYAMGLSMNLGGTHYNFAGSDAGLSNGSSYVDAVINDSPTGDTLNLKFFEAEEDIIGFSKSFNLLFTDTTGSVFDSKELPNELNLEDFSTITITADHFEWECIANEFGCESGGYHSQENFNAEYLPNPVPLPPAIYLFITGILGIFGINHRGISDLRQKFFS